MLHTPHLLSGSVADNIRSGRKDATLDEVKRAAAMVRADRFIEALPDGYGTEAVYYTHLSCCTAPASPR